MSRPSWDEYFLGLAKAASTRATCDRAHVGCVLVRDRVVVATGYNGSIAGLPHCDDVGHDMKDGHCVRTIHAEVNAISQAAKFGHAVLGATAYVTITPCWKCFQLLTNAGINEFVFGDDYRTDPRVTEAAKARGIDLRKCTR